MISVLASIAAFCVVDWRPQTTLEWMCASAQPSLSRGLLSGPVSLVKTIAHVLSPRFPSRSVALELASSCQFRCPFHLDGPRGVGVEM